LCACPLLGLAAPSPQEFFALPLSAAQAGAVSNAPDVAAARARVRENQYILAATRGARAPAATFNYVQNPQAGPTGGTITQRLVTLGGQITLGDYFIYGPAVRQAQENLIVAERDLQNAERAERAKTAGLYFIALRSGASVALRQDSLRSAIADRQAAQKRYITGAAPRLDVVRADLAVSRANADLDGARVARADAVQALSIETGLPANAFMRVRPSRLSGVAVLEPSVAVKRALALRSDVASAQAAVNAEMAAVDVSRRGILPAVTFSAGYTRGTDAGVTVHGPSANLLVSLPISHVSADRSAAEEARLEQSRARLAAVARQIEIDVSSAARSYAASIRAVQAATRVREEAAAELRAVEIGYRNGASSSLDVSDARRTYVAAQIDELNAIYAQAQAGTTLQELLGP
ncbi:MAG: TolC family protein, partial [Candidatus Eremiobacteraeota bacterium]|nr:TolC family protein [Candidatus Eremiobacteraeota bacterium]